MYSPTESFLLRGTFQRAVRAPSINELFAPITESFHALDEDPCSNDSEARAGPDVMQVEQLCVDQGLPVAALPVYNYANQQVAGGLAGGNPDLFEETADTLSFGVVFQSPFDGVFANLQASVDFYQIHIEDAIATVDASTFIARCYDRAFNPTFDVNNIFCSLFRRDPVTSEIIDAIEQDRNLAQFKAEGIDLQLDWGMDIGSGSLGVSWIATHLTGWERQALPGDSFVDLSGTIGNRSIGIEVARPDWKWSLNADYSIGNLGLNARWRHIDSMVDDTQPTVITGDVDYFDLGATYDFSDLFGGTLGGLVARVGVTNVGDKDPPIIAHRVQANTDPSSFDTLGRRYFVNLTYTFE